MVLTSPQMKIILQASIQYGCQSNHAFIGFSFRFYSSRYYLHSSCFLLCNLCLHVLFINMKLPFIIILLYNSYIILFSRSIIMHVSNHYSPFLISNLYHLYNYLLFYLQLLHLNTLLLHNLNKLMND